MQSKEHIQDWEIFHWEDKIENREYFEIKFSLSDIYLHTYINIQYIYVLY